MVTFITDEVFIMDVPIAYRVESIGIFCDFALVGKFHDKFCVVPDTFVSQISLKELKTNEGKDTQAENSQDHNICKLLNRLDKGTNDDLQTCRGGATTMGQNQISPEKSNM